MFDWFRKTLKIDDDLAHLRQRAEQGEVEAQRRLAVLLVEGADVQQNTLEAATWFHRAAELGDRPSQYNYAVLLTSGVGVPKNHVEAAKWFLKAAEQGDADAQCRLGRMYAKGKGVPLDQVEAYKWFYLASEQGNAQADEGCAVVGNQLSTERLEEAKRRAEDVMKRLGALMV